MNKTIFAAVVLYSLLICVCIAFTGRHNAETITSEKMSNSVVRIQCEDEHEPVVTKLENQTEIVVTCEAK